jgi:hypothetical protein
MLALQEKFQVVQQPNNSTDKEAVVMGPLTPEYALPE